MNRRTIVVACLLVAAVLAYARADSVSTTYSDHGGAEWKQDVSRESLLKSPKWNPEKAPCPLSAAKAIGAARAFLSKKFPETAKWRPSEIVLSSVLTPDRWVYDIAFEPKEGFHAGDLRVTVLLDGTVPKMTKGE